MQLIISGLIIIALALLISLGLRRLKPNWSPRKIGLISAAILPAIIVVLGVFLFVSAAMANPERCGENACRFAKAVATVYTGAAIIEFLLGWVAVIYFQRWLANRK